MNMTYFVLLYIVLGIGLFLTYLAESFPTGKQFAFAFYYINYLDVRCEKNIPFD